MVPHTPIRDLEQRLRDAVNVPKVKEQLIQDQRLWLQLCSSMDVIGDTEIAIVAFLDLPAEEDIGQLYLFAYGLLQVLFVQQDAVRHAAEAIGLSYKFSEKLLSVRSVRNDAIGHPTKRGGKKPGAFGIVQASLSHEGFTLYSFDGKRPDAFQPIKFQELITSQSAEVAQAIEQMILGLEKIR